MGQLNILLIEDDRGDALLIQSCLSDPHLGPLPRSRCVERLAAGIALLDSEDFSIVLCDLSLPDAQGLDTVRRLLAAAPGVPVIVLTGRDDPAFSLQLIEMGVQDYINKNELAPQLLRRAIAYAIERHKLHQQLRLSMRREQLRRTTLTLIAEERPLAEVLTALAGGLAGEAGCRDCCFVVQAGEDEADITVAPAGAPLAAEALCLLESRRRGELGTLPGAVGEGPLRGHALYDAQGRFLGLMLHGGGAGAYAEGLEAFVTGLGVQLAVLAVERHRAHRAQELAASVFAASEQGIVITGADNRVIRVSPSFCALMGFSEDEVRGHTPSLWNSGHHSREFYQGMWRELHDKGHWSGEILDRRKNGELITLLANISLIRDAEGRVIRHVCMLTDISARKEAEAIITRQANFDILTGLPNRRLFIDRLEQELLRARRNSSALALLFIDLDHFKEVNDTLGHQQGDLLLQQAAQRLSAVVRSTDTVARLGGDEFTMLLPDLAQKADVEMVAEKILAALGEHFQLQGERVHVSASIGITLFPDDAAGADQLLRNADQAMYRAKQQGRARFCYFTAEMQLAAVRRLRLHQDLLLAFERREFRLHFQPIVDVAAGRVDKAEVLVRWVHPERGYVSPMEFIPLAEDVGLISRLGDWIMGSALQQMRDWEAHGLPGVRLTVNKSPRQFLSRAGQDWLAMIRDAGVDPARLTLEITEGLLLDAHEDVFAKLKHYRDAGVSIAIDDFGTGYSSLSYLKRFPIDLVKIDKSFIGDIAVDPNDRSLVEAIVAMTHKLGMEVVAEGVETAEQRDILLATGCRLMQGYLFSRPLPGSELPAQLALLGGRLA